MANGTDPRDTLKTHTLAPGNNAADVETSIPETAYPEGGGAGQAPADPVDDLNRRLNQFAVKTGDRFDGLAKSIDGRFSNIGKDQRSLGTKVDQGFKDLNDTLAQFKAKPDVVVEPKTAPKSDTTDPKLVVAAAATPAQERMFDSITTLIERSTPAKKPGSTGSPANDDHPSSARENWWPAVAVIGILVLAGIYGADQGWFSPASGNAAGGGILRTNFHTGSNTGRASVPTQPTCDPGYSYNQKNNQCIDFFDKPRLAVANAGCTPGDVKWVPNPAKPGHTLRRECGY